MANRESPMPPQAGFAGKEWFLY